MPRRRRHSAAVRFRLTGAGWVFLAVAVLVGVAAVKTYDRPMMYVLFGGMFGAVHASAFLVRRMLRGVAVQQRGPSRVWQDQTVHVGYLLRNRRRRGTAMALRLKQLIPRQIQSADGYCAQLPPGASFRAGARFVARQRGRFVLRGLRVETSFPFGLVAANRRFGRPTELVVWPARGQLRRQLLRRGALESSAEAPSRDSGGQDEFFGLREYREGDSPRWVHWRRSAGRRMPVVREMARPLPDILWVLLETRLTDSTGDGTAQRERMLRFAATIIEYAFFRGYRVGMGLGGAAGPRLWRPAGGRGQRRQLLDALADVGATDHSLSRTLGALHRADLADAEVIAVTPDAAVGDALADLRGACRRLRVIRPAELSAYFIDDAPAAVDAPSQEVA
ncbi:MAG: DUF58 domain-containing protein [Phycisphaerae bacterium]|nr:DUF58 domain-containing protein [Phycisphaerae bacterium]